jgi:lipoate-protein ligase A
MDTWRLIYLETHDAFMNMAIDEAILTARMANKVPNTLRLYKWQPSAVSIGRNQNLDEEVYSETAHSYGVDLVRRISGGGAVYHDQNGEVTYSVTAETASLGKDIPSVYQRIYEAVVDAIRIIGISADFSPGNTKNCPNLTVNNRKISGSAQTVRRGIVLQHGTILLDADLQKMFELLRIRSTSDCTQAAQIAENKITSIKNELRHPVTAETAANALIQGFRAILKIRIESGLLTPYEEEIAKKLCREKYATRSWNALAKTV